MYIFKVNEKKHLEVFPDQRLYYSDADSLGENSFAHCKIKIPAIIVNNEIGDEENLSFTAVLRCYTSTVDSETAIENDIELTLNYSSDDDEYISNQFDLTDDIICGVGHLDAYVEFTGSASELGMTNAVRVNIYDVLTNDTEIVYPKVGCDTAKLDSILAKQVAINERLGGLYG